MKNARFWETSTKGNPVKITLRPGQTLRHFHAQRTDEGWSSTSIVFEHEGALVSCYWQTDGVDCDGRLTRAGVSYCALEQLAAGWRSEDDGVTFPAWKAEDEWQRDYSAEAAGY